MRLTLAFTLTSLIAAACGGDDGDAPPDANNDNGFNPPTVTLKANMELSEDNWMEIGDADLSCLGTTSDDVASTVSVTLNTKVTDFQSGNAVPSSTVIVFPNQDQGSPFDTQTSDSTAAISFTIPIGTKRFGYKMTSGNALPTLLLNQKLSSPSMPVQMVTEIQSVSNATAATLPALIGQTRTQGTGVVAGALRDCQRHEVSGFVATMSTTPTTASPVAGAEAYYFSSGVGLPVHHNQQQYSTEDGLFMIIQVPTTSPMGYVQMWGFPTAGDLAMGMAGLKLIAELQVPIFGDTVITGSYEPVRL
jgi:hypothetical protein